MRQIIWQESKGKGEGATQEKREGVELVDMYPSPSRHHRHPPQLVSNALGKPSSSSQSQGSRDHGASGESCPSAFTRDARVGAQRPQTTLKSCLCPPPSLPCCCWHTNLCLSWPRSSWRRGAQRCWQGQGASPGSARHGGSHGGLGRTGSSAGTRNSPPAGERIRASD